MPSNENWQAEALADAARFAKRQAERNQPAPPEPAAYAPSGAEQGEDEDSEDIILEGERCDECGWELQAATNYCANCGAYCFYEDPESEVKHVVEDTGVPAAAITSAGACSSCGWVLQDESYFCGGCGKRVRADEDLASYAVAEDDLGDGSIFSFLKRKKRS